MENEDETDRLLTKLTLREYQIQMIEKCLKQNSIIFLPTGSGKTLIVLNILRKFWKTFNSDEEGEKKIGVILANTKALVIQLSAVVQEFTDYVVEWFSGEMGVDNWSEMCWLKALAGKQIIVTVPAIFLILLQRKLIKLCQVEVLVFDECHHTVSNHPFNMIMKEYRFLPESEKKPLIIGLTAVMLHSNPKQNIWAHVEQLKNNLCSQFVKADCIQEVFRYSVSPKEAILPFSFSSKLHVEADIKDLLNRTREYLKELKIYTDQDLLADAIVPESFKLLARKQSVIKEICRSVVIMDQTLTELGLYCTSFAALHYLIRMERLKLMGQQHLPMMAITYFITVLNTIRSLIRHAVPDEEAIDYSVMCTDKVNHLLSLVRKYENANVTCLVFVEMKITAIILACLFNKISFVERNEFLKADYIIGGLFSSVLDTKEVANEQRLNMLAIKRLKNGECHFLFATDVIEEGIDLPSCNVVIKFDRPKSYKSYIQSRGRARSKDSDYVIFCERDEVTSLQQEIQSHKNLNATLLQVLHQPERLEISTSEVISDEEEYFYTGESHGPRISGSTAISLVFKYCSTLPQDGHGGVLPLCWYDENTKSAFLYLPMSSRVKNIIQGNSRQTRKLAKKNVFLKAVKELFLNKEIMADFSLRNYKHIEEEYKYLYPNLEMETNSESSYDRDTSKRKKRVFEANYGQHLSDCLPQPGTLSYLHVIKMTPIFERPDDRRDGVFYDLMGSSDCFAILSSKQHPRIFDFPLFSILGELKCSLVVNEKCIQLSSTDIAKIKKFHFFLFHSLLNVVRRLQVFNCCPEGHSFYIVPVKLLDYSTYSVDWDVINILNCKSEVVTVDELISENENIEDYFANIVFTKYRQTVSGSKLYYIVTSLDRSQTPLSKFPSDEFDNYYTYFKKRYEVDISNKSQPLIEVKPIPNTTNYLTPSNVLKKLRKNQKGVESYHVHLVPELCRKVKFPSSLWLKATMLPSALHRITTTSLIYDMRKLIVSQTKLGITDIDETISWLPLEVEPDYEGEQVDNTWLSSKNEVNLTGRRRLVQNDARGQIDPFRNMFDCAPCDLKHYWKQFKALPDEINTDTEIFHPVEVKCDKVKVSPRPKEITVPDLPILNKPDIRLGPELRDFMKVFTCKKARDIISLERLEFLGDSFLKFAASFYLYKNIVEHEGVLSSIKDNIVCNRNLYHCAITKGLHQAIQINEFAPKSDWEAPLFSLPYEIKCHINGMEDPFEVDYSLEITPEEKVAGKLSDKTIAAISRSFSNEDKNLTYTPTEFLVARKSVSDKSIADTVEALLGLFVMDCGLFGAFRIINWLNILPLNGGSYDDLMIGNDFNNSEISSIDPEVYLKEVSYKTLEETLGYEFKHKYLLLQALTHPSFGTLPSYQRLEFLGDSILDFITVVYVYNYGKELGPGKMTDIKMSMVNNVTLACLSVKYNFHKNLLHRSPTLLTAMRDFADYQKERNHKIDDSVLFFYEENMSHSAETIEVPKALGDLFEAIFGAIFLDSGNSFKTVWKIFYTLAGNVLDHFMINPPKSSIRMLYEMYNPTPDFSFEVMHPGVIQATCRLTDGGKEIHFYGRGKNRKQAKLSAAKVAVLFLLKKSSNIELI